jgi:hypothetical protein
MTCSEIGATAPPAAATFLGNLRFGHQLAPASGFVLPLGGRTVRPRPVIAVKLFADGMAYAGVLGFRFLKETQP